MADFKDDFKKHFEKEKPDKVKKILTTDELLDLYDG